MKKSDKKFDWDELSAERQLHLFEGAAVPSDVGFTAIEYAKRYGLSGAQARFQVRKLVTLGLVVKIGIRRNGERHDGSFAVAYEMKSKATVPTKLPAPGMSLGGGRKRA